MCTQKWRAQSLSIHIPCLSLSLRLRIARWASQVHGRAACTPLKRIAGCLGHAGAQEHALVGAFVTPNRLHALLLRSSSLLLPLRLLMPLLVSVSAAIHFMRVEVRNIDCPTSQPCLPPPTSLLFTSKWERLAYAGNLISVLKAVGSQNAGGLIVTPKSRWLISGRLPIVTPKSLYAPTTVDDVLRIGCITPPKE